MVWYLLNILVLTIAWILLCTAPEKKKVGEIEQQEGISKKRRKIFCIIATVGWILLSGLRDVTVGSDTKAYFRFFTQIKGTSWETIFKMLYAKYFKGQPIKDPGYSLLEKIFQIFSKDYQWFLVFIAVLFFVGMGIFIYKYSCNPYVSFVLFSCLFYSFFAVTGHRQTIATATGVWIGVEFIKKKKLIPFLILIALSSTIHHSVICFLPFYWIAQFKVNKYTLIIYWVAVALAFLFRDPMFEFLKRVMGYDKYEEFEGAGSGVFLYLLLGVGVFVTLFYEKLVEGEEGGMITLSINALFCACVFSSLLLINQSTMRVVQYYSIFLMILLPKISSIFSKYKETLVFDVICTALMVLLLIFNNPVYKFFWQ